ncbi:hypothetical protein CBR_g32504 [Chara braunii]|uniref:Uncharacterized protein n=1 Tax=Chara braunii TaxID=69332 RepID=A0A388LGV3_CHABU|nr:hypothetical protein CBR_g32504 [Chara braunii]|eukprot:GBG81515.1 hypothetical protein CBR_g32504 [Chara braunii]
MGSPLAFVRRLLPSGCPSSREVRSRGNGGGGLPLSLIDELAVAAAATRNSAMIPFVIVEARFLRAGCLGWFASRPAENSCYFFVGRLASVASGGDKWSWLQACLLLAALISLPSFVRSGRCGTRWLTVTSGSGSGDGRSRWAMAARAGRWPLALGDGRSCWAMAARWDFLAPHCGSMATVIEVKTDNPPVFPQTWKFQIESRSVEVKVSTKSSPICFRCRERGHMGTNPNCPKYPNQPKERKLLPNMLVEVEDAPGIWFIPDSNYNGWVFDDNLEVLDWAWHYADQEPEVKKPNVFPPADNRWQKRATGKVAGNPSKITTDPLIDSRVIKEEKDREDLLWDLEAVKEQAILHFNKDSTDFRSMLLKMEQTSTQNRIGAQTDNKRTMENGKTQGIQEGGLKRRKAVDAQEEVVSLPADKEGEDGRTDSGGTGSEKTSESGKGEGDNKVSDSEGDSHRSLQWLRDYVEKVKREREQAFDIRAACHKYAERSQRNGKKGMGEVGKLSNQFDVLRTVKAEELSEYTAFRYAEKKRAREQGVKDRDRTAPKSKDDFQDLRPKKWKSGQNQKKKNPNMTQSDFEEESARTRLEKEAAVVIAQTEEVNKLNDEYSAEFTTITHIVGSGSSGGRDSQVVKTGTDEHPPLDCCKHSEHGRHSPQAFSPLIVKLSNKEILSSGMRWRSWRTIQVVPYSVLAGSCLPAELAAVSLAQLVTTGMLEGNGDLDARAYPVDWERFYRSDESEGEDQAWHSDDEKEEDDQEDAMDSDNEVKSCL